MNPNYLAAAAVLAVFAIIVVQQRRKDKKKPKPPLPEVPPEDITSQKHYDDLLEEIEKLTAYLSTNLDGQELQDVLRHRSFLVRKYEQDRKKAYPAGGGPKPIDELLKT